MKNTTKSILITLLISSAFNFNAQKLGHVNSQAIVQEMPDYESARKELESYKSDLAKELEMYQKLIMEFAQDYDQKKSEMSADSRQRKEADLMERQQNYEKKAYEAEQKLQQKEQELLQAIMLKVNNAVKELAKKDGYSYIFEVSTLLHAGGDDISDKVRGKLGITTSN
ncbi:OmpH family outer membrane protein [Flavobacteriales bacterium]|nr:OmpH family outer membrane protein [Flavobacteriales bacterium]